MNEPAIEVILFDLGGVLIELVGVETMLEWSPGVASNEIHWQRFAGEWSLDAAFHRNFPSHQVGKLKPDANYFAHVLEAMDARPEHVLLIDDNANNVEAAAALGIVARRVAGIDGARRAFAELKLKPF